MNDAELELFLSSSEDRSQADIHSSPVHSGSSKSKSKGGPEEAQGAGPSKKRKRALQKKVRSGGESPAPSERGATVPETSTPLPEAPTEAEGTSERQTLAERSPIREEVILDSETPPRMLKPKRLIPRPLSAFADQRLVGDLLTDPAEGSRVSEDLTETLEKMAALSSSLHEATQRSLGEIQRVAAERDAVKAEVIDFSARLETQLGKVKSLQLHMSVKDRKIKELEETVQAANLSREQSEKAKAEAEDALKKFREEEVPVLVKAAEDGFLEKYKQSEDYKSFFGALSKEAKRRGILTSFKRLKTAGLMTPQVQALGKVLSAENPSVRQPKAGAAPDDHFLNSEMRSAEGQSANE